MTIQYDEKGKIFTNIVQKETVVVTIQTRIHQIHGTIYVRLGERIKDELDQCAKFLPVTDLVVFDLNGNTLYQSSFMLVNLDQIIWLIPDAEMVVASNDRNPS